ncbi:hypothetical protein BS50DRAFT_576443 [Corynespora cassiicola Philippines]|uniref:BTB domain-containing protein n=1 Tax=Corynespora cassiicola Philippines TaxID=1448308 RepID=A0A2T2NEL6_CORCC|nr:hypothetical protein BS50DRAFT_576443 [Corynespora cassiicola Philippines]
MNPSIGMVGNQAANGSTTQASNDLSNNAVIQTNPAAFPVVRRSRPSIATPNQKFAKIIVGEKQESFTVHAALLTRCSSYFDKALNGKFQEAIDGVVVLKDEDPQIFQQFVHWLYYDKFPGESLDDDAGLVKQWQGQNIFDGRLSVNLMRLYVFGEKRIISRKFAWRESLGILHAAA